VSQYQKKHSPTHHTDRHPIFIIFFHLPQSIASSLFKLRAWQSFCTTSFHVSLVYHLVWSPPPHTPYISLPNQCLLFAAHVNTTATCFAIVSILYHLFHHRHGPKMGGCAPFFRGGEAGYPTNTMWPGPRPTSVPSGILIHPVVWPQYMGRKVGAAVTPLF